ncbi:MAG: YicC family protein [Lachnospiraceae bacterium]|nr:YicC family protein [Lachnospiraceae bacterium]
MLKSMTGFGRCELSEDGKKISVEMKSVNHRYCEIGLRMPKKLNYYESLIRNTIKQYANRGKIDVFISYEDEKEGLAGIRYNRELAATYVGYIRQMAEEFGLSADISAAGLARMQDVIVNDDSAGDEEQLKSLVERAVTGACEKFVETRLAEGEHLKQDIFGKLDGLLEGVAFIEHRSPEIVEEYRNKLNAKIREVLGDTQIDQNVLATELVIYADKICTDEETVRLRAHIKNMKETLNVATNIGRKLDFIAQEMNREANTILSKANDMQVSDTAINLKTEIEKIREQIQNIE